MYDWEDDEDDDISEGASYYDDDSASDLPIIERNHQSSRVQTHVPALEPGSQFVRDLKLHAENGNIEALLCFLNSLPPTNPVSADGDRPDEENKREMVDVDVGEGWSALMHASERGRIQAVELLLSRGANPNLKADDGTTPLLAVCASTKAEEENAAEMVKILVKAGARLVEEDSADSFTRPPTSYPLLHIAARLNQPMVIGVLVESGLSVNSRDSYDWTPLMVAADKGALAAANTLLKIGADPLLRIRPRRGFDPNTVDATAATLASLSGHTQLSDSLRVLSGQTAGDDRLYRVLRRLREEQEAEDREEEEDDELEKKRADELATFLHGVGLYELLPKMRAQGISLSLLMKTSDSQLKEMGIEKIGDRTRILNTVHEMHKVAWTEDKPAHLELGKPLKLRDVVAVIGNTSRHLEFLDASVSYVSSQLREYREFYVTSVEIRPNAPVMLGSMDGICEEGIESCKRLFYKFHLLKSQAAAVRGEAKVVAVPDLIPPSFSLKRKRKTRWKLFLPVVGAVLIFFVIRRRQVIFPRLLNLLSKLTSL